MSTTITGVSGPPATSGLDPDQLPWWARRTGFGWINVITGVLSLLATAVLVGERIQLYMDAGHRASCDFGTAFSCTSVMKSEAAALFGFPNPFIGLVGFTVLVVVGVVAAVGAALPRWFWNTYFVGVLAAFVFLVWLYSQAVYSIRALCIYCMVCWLMMIFLVFITLARNVLTGVMPAPAWLRAWARDWAWITAIVVAVACAASIIIAFMPQLLG